MDGARAVDAALAVVTERYRPQLVVLYGSFAAGTQTPSSDIDLLVFADLPAAAHDSGLVAGHPLDAWIYPLNHLRRTALFGHILPCRALVDHGDHFPGLLRRVEARRQRSARPLPEAERAQLTGWVAKMVARAAVDDDEGLYRYRWLVQDLPELWCRFSARPYDGPKKTLALLAAEQPAMHRLLVDLLRTAPDHARLTDLVAALTS